MTITYEDLEKLSQEMHEQKEQQNRDFFACFEKADYDRGDKIVLSQVIADKIAPLRYDKERVSVSGYLKPGNYVVLAGEVKKSKLEFKSEFYSVLKNPRSIISCTGS